MKTQPENSFVLGQRYQLATLALIVGLLSFVNLAGIEKAVLAAVLGLKALAAEPLPALERRRGWAKTAIALGAVHIVLLTTIVLLNLDRLGQLIETLRTLSDLR